MVLVVVVVVVVVHTKIIPEEKGGTKNTNKMGTRRNKSERKTPINMAVWSKTE